MTAAENMSITPRDVSSSTNRNFAFYCNGSRFFPQAGARMSYASRAPSSLYLPGLPPDFAGLSSTITVTFSGRVVFSGSVEKYSERTSRGSKVVDVTALDGWNALERKAFRQSWTVSNGLGIVLEESSSHVVLNVDAEGIPVALSYQLSEIIASASLMMSDGGVPDIVLPADETRNITCADAIRRCLRFFPNVVAVFDPSSGNVSFKVPSGIDASYIGGETTISRNVNYIAHPVVGVDISTEDVDTSLVDDTTGMTVCSRAFTHQTAGDTSSPDCLHVFLPLAGSHASSSYETLVVETEELPPLSTPRFWQGKHPRLANVALDAISITEEGRSSATYDQITSNDIGALKAFGLNAELVHCHCKATITTEDDIEEELYLTMDFVMTDASPGRHTRQTGSSSTASERLPEGLAQAVLDQRGGSLESEDIVIRIVDSFPKIGDSADGLVLQNFDVDCDTLVANLHFGHPDYLTPEDMRELMNGFRSRGSSGNVPIRGDNDLAEDANEIPGGVMPLTTTEFAPGTKKKTTIKSTSGGGSIVLDCTSVDAGKKVEIHKLKFTPPGESEQKTVKILADEDMEMPAGGGSAAEHAAESDTNITFEYRQGVGDSEKKLYVGVYYK